MGETAGLPENYVLIDTHVHFHCLFDRVTFLDAAVKNMHRAANALGAIGSSWHCLLLTEIAGATFFRDLRASKKSMQPGWKLCETGEPESLILQRDNDRLVIVSGWQVATQERLEVLALSTNHHVPTGASLNETIEASRAAGAIPVIPWGFGKWWGRRGEHVADAIRTAMPGTLYLGDNAGRLTRSPRPPLFALAEDHGLAVLPGSDPLPFASQCRTAGSYVMALRGSLDPTHPAKGIRRLITDSAATAQTVGRREGLAGFIRNQIGMQLRRQ
jgi:hypothetical protein